MVIVVRVEDIQKLIKEEIEAWESLAGGPNLDEAFAEQWAETYS